MTIAHHFTTEKCVNVHKTPAKKCDELNEYSCEKNVNDVDFDTNINRDMCMKVMILFIGIKLRIAYKHIYLHHAYFYLHHLCA